MIKDKWIVRRNTFKYMIFSYIFVFVLPLLLIISFVQIYFINELYKSAIISSENDIIVTKNVIDDQIAQLFNITDSIYVDYEIMDSYCPEIQTSEVNLLKNRLRVLSLNAELPCESIIYCENDDYLYSTSSSISFPVFNYLNPIKGIFSGENFQQILNEIVEVEIFLPVEITNKSNIIYTIPIKSSRGNKVVLFIIQNFKLQKFLKNMLSNNIGCAFITDNSGRVISYINNDINNDINYFTKILYYTKGIESLAEINNNVLQQSIKYNGNTYITNSAKSKDGKLLYTTIISRGILVAQKSRQFMLWLWVIVATLVMGLIFAFLFANVSYKPVKQIKNGINKIVDINKFDSIRIGKNDFDYIRSSIEYLASKNTVMQSNIKDITDYLIFKLFKGEIGNIDEINRLNNIFNISLYTAGFQVCILAFDKYIDNNELAEYIRNLLPCDLSAVIRITATKNIYAMVISFKSKSSCSLVPFLNLLLEKMSSLFIVAVGNIQNTIQRIPDSYNEASVAFEYIFSSNASGLQFYKDVKYSCDNTSIIKNFSKHIDEYDKNDAQMMLIDIETRLETEQISIKNAHVLFLDLIIFFTNKFSSIDFNNNMLNYPNVLMIKNYKNIDSFINMIKDMQSDLSVLISKLHEKEYILLLNNMKDYLNKNYCSPQFSLEQMSNEFDMTVSSLSKFFSNITGVNIIDYVAELKIKNAKKLLEETDMSVSEIGIKIGYYNASSFIRRFKQIVDKTPGEFRKNIQKEE